VPLGPYRTPTPGWGSLLGLRSFYALMPPSFREARIPEARFPGMSLLGFSVTRGNLSIDSFVISSHGHSRSNLVGVAVKEVASMNRIPDASRT